jgi:hypothetical protein
MKSKCLLSVPKAVVKAIATMSGSVQASRAVNQLSFVIGKLINYHQTWSPMPAWALSSEVDNAIGITTNDVALPCHTITP